MAANNRERLKSREAKKVKAYIRTSDYTQGALAEYVGVSSSVISQVLHGKAGLKDEQYANLHGFFEKTEDLSFLQKYYPQKPKTPATKTLVVTSQPDKDNSINAAWEYLLDAYIGQLRPQYTSEPINGKFEVIKTLDTLVDRE